ncbi:hypothetical protein PIB30_056375 [Stylosanthes scabra]|uniref:Uncharacterized protein n=1 Tax=Stylosanthes scabra TaxID=79078 RepID=A0ABU6TK87_9FABA|nr:hypothetical protein [Stylosanthes scabra]
MAKAARRRLFRSHDITKPALNFTQSLFFHLHPSAPCHPPVLRPAVVAAAPPTHAHRPFHHHYLEPNLTAAHHYLPKETGTSEIGSSGEIAEAIKTKSLCEIGGISFKSIKEAKLLATIVGRKSQKNLKGEVTGKKLKPVKLAPNLKGRNLSTRILRLGSKPKLR